MVDYSGIAEGLRQVIEIFLKGLAVVLLVAIIGCIARKRG